jgi:RNA 2',3'-cyclic 3'-phosphodiesterase
MRLFVAVEISDEARRVAAGVAERIRQKLGAGAVARWVDPDSMHLTVRFVGFVPDERVPAVMTALHPPLPVAPFEIVFGSCGVFPASGAPRVIWIGLRQGRASLAAMHDEFNRRLRPLGFEPESRSFSAHLTIARVKQAPAAVRRTIAETTVGPMRCPVTKATVFESILSRQGARYQRVAEVNCLPSTAC